jgi:uncharacterized membrane protein
MLKAFFSLATLREKYMMAVVSILYLVGIAGFLFRVHPDFALLTPINLLVSLAAALAFHTTPTRTFWLACAAVALLGFLIEVVGVNTGLLFGPYSYGRVLGFKLWQTPLSIAVNWLLLVYSSSVFVSYFLGTTTHRLIKVTLAAALMVILDFFIEPVAIATDMWTWDTGFVPLQNYIGWFVSAFLLHLIMSYFTQGEKNRVAVTVLFWQFVFFLVL